MDSSVLAKTGTISWLFAIQERTHLGKRVQTSNPVIHFLNWETRNLIKSTQLSLKTVTDYEHQYINKQEHKPLSSVCTNRLYCLSGKKAKELYNTYELLICCRMGKMHDHLSDAITKHLKGLYHIKIIKF